MAFVLCAGGLDPSGGAGLAADIRALAFLKVDCLPVASAFTAQNSRNFYSLEPVTSKSFERALRSAIEETKPGAFKSGLLGSVENVKVLASLVKKNKAPFVLDPVFKSSTGYTFADKKIIEAYKNKLFPLASLVTPNASEASVLTGIKVKDVQSAKKACLAISEHWPKAVLVKGGHFTSQKGTDILYFGKEFYLLTGTELPGNPRGTGCTYASLIAGYLAMGLEVPDAVSRAKEDMARALAFSQTNKSARVQLSESFTKERREVWLAVQKAAYEALSIITPELMPEVGINIGFSLKNAKGLDDVCTLDSRIVLKGKRPVTIGTPVFGKDSHVAKVILAAVKRDRNTRSAMNLKYSDTFINIIRNMGLRVVSFDRSGEPGKKSTMEWGTGRAFEALGSTPDAIFDLGAKGKEPMIRLLASNPEELLEKLRDILEI